METHIGNLIAAKMKELHISPTELARRLQMKRINSYNILKRKSIQTNLLQRISKAINYDFFQHFTLVNNEQLLKQIASLEKKISEQEAEIKTLNRVIETLKH